MNDGNRRRNENSGAVAISVPGLKEAVNRLIDRLSYTNEKVWLVDGNQSFY
jgi:hypothetical protein